MLGADDHSAARCLADLRRAQPADATLRNLVGVLTAKLDLCARLPVYEWEATNEGHGRCADAFHRLAEAERRSCSDVVDSLKAHLDDSAPVRRGGQR